MSYQEKLQQVNNFLRSFSYRGVIGLIIVCASFGFLFLLVYKAVPEQNKDIINVAGGLILAVLANVAGYYFGSSKDKSDSDKADHVNTILNSDSTNTNS